MNSKLSREEDRDSKFIVNIDSELKVNSRKQQWIREEDKKIQSGFARMVMNSYWQGIRIEYVKWTVNSLWIGEEGSEFVVNLRYR